MRVSLEAQISGPRVPAHGDTERPAVAALTCGEA